MNATEFNKETVLLLTPGAGAAVDFASSPTAATSAPALSVDSAAAVVPSSALVAAAGFGFAGYLWGMPAWRRPSARQHAGEHLRDEDTLLSA